ncbi:MAG: DEAD/DEAH box helicase [Rhizobiaceae bacterium]|nr:DEAD/DEAH box helicase [Rhizobiaceae bacterium]
MTISNPLAVDRQLRQRVTAAVIAQAGIRHDALNAFLRARLSGSDAREGALFAEPVVEGAPGYVSSGLSPGALRGSLLHPALVDALIGRAGDDHRFDYPAFAHQLEAWEQLLKERRSVLVSSGTGSGKTECFMVPMLDDLVREAESAGRLRGVRALMLYPLNALIASQEERLRRWVAPFRGKIRFALYNGLMLDKRKSERDKAEQDVPEQVLYRGTLRSDPPPVLVTNLTMLEYMTIRKEDHPILQASQGQLRWIVIDEAHSYVGSAAAELSLLLRRVLQAFGVKARDVRFVATSATIGDGSEADRGNLQRYLADLAGVPIDQVHVVIGKPRPVTLGPRRDRSGPIDLDRPDAVSCHPAVHALVGELERGAVPMARVEAAARQAGAPAIPFLEAVAGSVLPMRVHKFIRAVPGLWSCLNPACKGDRPEGWPFGPIHFERSEICTSCGAPVFEVISCRECGEPLLNAFDHGDRLSPEAAPPDRDEFEATSARERDEGGDDDEEDGATAVSQECKRRLIGSRPANGLVQRDLDLTSGALPDRRGAATSVQLSPKMCDGSCPCCHAKPSRRSSRILWPFRFGAPFLIQNAAPTVLEGVSPSPRSDIELPSQGRQLISFTDSRQGTARFAANIETMSERSFVRSFVYHSVQKAARPESLDAAKRSELEAERAVIAPHAGSIPSLGDRLRTIEDQLRGTGTVKPVPWSHMVKALSDEPMLSRWIGNVWDADRDERFRDPGILANFLILRELARRPRRANALETLGLARLVFPQIDNIADDRVPRPLRERGFAKAHWTDYLYFLIDLVRSNFVLNVSREDARWLLPRHAFLRTIVGPGQDRRSESDMVWPLARAGAGRQANPVLALEQSLALDSGSGEDRGILNAILQDAWDQLRPVFEGTGSTYALDIEKAHLGPVAEAWICPITHRVLPRLVFGQTPYALRLAPSGDRPAPAAANFPRLPIAFPLAGERAELEGFIQTDPVVRSLRSRGIWTDLHDRAATYASYMRAEEHSAQQQPHRLRAFEAQFKQGEINLLACSTTMEMGVDIGSVEAVLNTNVPPSIANYRQRVGRAGRRGQSFSSSLTFARDTPLDREAFTDPAAYLRSSMCAPQVRLDSRRIVQRHANALLLGEWFRQSQAELMRVRSGSFFGCPEGLSLAGEENPPVDRFCAWLNDPSTAADMAARLRALLDGTALHDVDNVPENCSTGFDEARKAYRDQWNNLRDQAAGLTPEAKGSIENQLRRLCREPLLKELSARSLLPGHGFPNAVVPFINDCAETAARQKLRFDEESETVRNRRYDYPSRKADVAIREYAPGGQVVIDGLVWTSAGVTLNWERPAHDAAAREVQSIKWSWQCRDCGEVDCGVLRPHRCTACDSSALDGLQFLQPAGFRVDWSEKPHGETDRIDYIEPQPVRISARDAGWVPLRDPSVGRARATADGLVFHHSLGIRKRGYNVCLRCGRAAEESEGNLAGHAALTPQKGQAGRCDGNDRTYAITNPLALGFEALTDVAELQLTGLDGVEAAWALASALRTALARRLAVDVRELGLAVSPRHDAIGRRTHSIFLFDLNAGGAGYAPRLLDDVQDLLTHAARILDCPRNCVKGCSHCILVADLHAQQDLLDRHAALESVTDVLAAVARWGRASTTGRML